MKFKLRAINLIMELEKQLAMRKYVSLIFGKKYESAKMAEKEIKIED